METMDKQPTSFSIDLKLEQLMQCNTRYDVSSFWGVPVNEEADAAAGAVVAGPSGVFDVLRHARNALEASDGGVERPYKCDLCPKRFAHPQTLDVHRRSHESGEATAATSSAHTAAGNAILPDGLETKPTLDCLRDGIGQVVIPQATPARGQFSVGGFATMVFGSLQHRYNIAGVAALVSDEQPRRYCVRATAVLDSDAFARPCPVSGIITVAGVDPPAPSAAAASGGPGTGEKKVRGAGERRFRCDVCAKMFRRNDHMIRHRRALHGPPQTTERVFQCDVCTKMFVRSDHLLRHRRTHRLSPTGALSTVPTTSVWPQAVAPKVEFAYDMFGRMLHVGTGEYFPGFVPPVASHPVPSAPVEKKPRTMREKRFRCFICAKMFTRKDHLVRHRHLVHRLPQHIAADLSPGADCRSLPLDFPMPPAGTDIQPPVPVPLTSSSSQPQQQQQQQQPDFHQIPAQDFRLSPATSALDTSAAATHCGDTDTTGGVAIDRNSSQYACAPCGVTFACVEHLRDHERLQHTGLPCNVTMIPYSAAPERDSVAARPGSARLRTCEVCGVSFASDSELREHMQRHVDGRPTASADGLALTAGVADHRRIEHNDHQRTTGSTATGGLFDASNALSERVIAAAAFPFDGTCSDTALLHTCDVCGRRFAHRSALQAHALSHANDRTFKCDLCDTSFYHAEKLRDHNLRVHKIDA